MKNYVTRHFRKGLVISRFISFVCLLVGHKLSENGKCSRCKKVIVCLPELPKKVIEILEKDAFDKKYGSVLEYGIISPLEYYKTKKFVIENDYLL